MPFVRLIIFKSCINNSISQYCIIIVICTYITLKNGIQIDEWIEETISGTLEPQRRQLGTLLDRVQKDDLIICSELSRLGRSLFMIMSILNKLMETGARVWTIKDGYRLGDDIQSKVLAFAFGLSAEIERNLISQRTKEALARKKAEGVHLGRPQGCKMKQDKYKLARYDKQIRLMLSSGSTFKHIAERFKVDRDTVSLYYHTFIRK